MILVDWLKNLCWYSLINDNNFPCFSTFEVKFALKAIFGDISGFEFQLGNLGGSHL